MHDCEVTKQRLAPNGRGVDNSFADAEHLFFRFSVENWIDGQLAVTAIRCPDFSVNRGRYSEAEDVTCPKWHDWGVIFWTVRQMRKMGWQKDTSARYALDVVHVPLEDEKNYAHSEVQFRKNGAYKASMRVAEGAKDGIRDALSRGAKSQVVKRPASAPSS